MRRITHATAAVSVPVPDESGTPGYFTKANPRAGVGSTWLTPEWLHRVQEELQSAGDLTGQGITAAIARLADYDNGVVNGGFDVWRFGGTFSTASPGPWNAAADGWFQATVGETMTTTRQEFAVGQTEVPGNPRYYTRSENAHAVGAANYSVLRGSCDPIRTAIPGAMFAGEPVCASFWARSDAACDAAFELYRGITTVGGAVVSCLTETFTLGTEWQHYAIRGTVPELESGAAYASGALYPYFWLSGGSDFAARCSGLGNQSIRLDLAQVSIVPGSAPYFAPVRIADEFARCAAYCRASFEYGVLPAAGAGLAGATVWPAVSTATASRTKFSVTHAPQMRDSAPSAARYNPVTSSSLQPRNVTRSTDSGSSSFPVNRTNQFAFSSNAPSGTQVNDKFAVHWVLVSK